MEIHILEVIFVVSSLSATMNIKIKENNVINYLPLYGKNILESSQILTYNNKHHGVINCPAQHVTFIIFCFTEGILFLNSVCTLLISCFVKGFFLKFSKDKLRREWETLQADHLKSQTTNINLFLQTQYAPLSFVLLFLFFCTILIHSFFFF